MKPLRTTTTLMPTKEDWKWQNDMKSKALIKNVSDEEKKTSTSPDKQRPFVAKPGRYFMNELFYIHKCQETNKPNDTPTEEDILRYVSDYNKALGRGKAYKEYLDGFEKFKAENTITNSGGPKNK